jgi:hypothetical protein
MMIKLAIASFVIGVILMIGFEYSITRVFGVAGLLGFVAFGVWAIADPEILRREDDAS